MTKAQYQLHQDEYMKFDRIKDRLSNRPDIHAFILLDQLVPGTEDLVGAASHDEIFLAVTPSDLAKVATTEQIVELIRCGVRYDSATDSLAMFV
jgi:hypothetical protein